MPSNRHGRRVRREAPRDVHASPYLLSQVSLVYLPSWVSQAPLTFFRGVSICALIPFRRPGGLLNRAGLRRNGGFPFLNPFLRLCVYFFDRPRPPVSGAREHEIQNAPSRPAVAGVGSNSQVFGERHRAFADPVIGSDVSKNRVGEFAVALVEDGRKISWARSQLARHSSGQHDERNPRSIYVARG